MINRKNKKTYWKCLCDCGDIVSTRGDTLQSGRIKSCGCLRRTNLYDLVDDSYYVGYDCNNQIFYIDKDDYEKVKKYRWIVNNVGYVMSSTTRDGMCGMLLHRYILNAPDDSEIDHANRKPIDCRKCNLRFCNRTQNNFNHGIRKDNSSGVKGVHFLKK